MTRAERAPSGSRYADQRHYAVSAKLTDLRGPRGGAVTLDRSLDWSGDGTYDLDDAGDLQLMYQAVLNQAATADDLSRWLDGDLLRRLWSSLWLPARLRALWESRFPDLVAPLEPSVDRDSADRVPFGDVALTVLVVSGGNNGSVRA
jgi:hypothetical protein